MSPNFRRAAHQALDIVLDAWAAEQDESQSAAKPKRRRGPVLPPLETPTRDLTPDEHAQLDRQLRRAGYKKAG